MQVDIILYDGFNLLEATSVLSVFSYANSHLARRGEEEQYEIKLTSSSISPVLSDVGVRLTPSKLLDTSLIPQTAIIVGAWNLSKSIDKYIDVIDWIRSARNRLNRIAALCSGVNLLAAAGLLADKPATTHWTVADDLKSDYPALELDAERALVRHGKIWTSAGATAAIDLALALVEEDLGIEITLDVARDLVIFLRRTEGYSQLSSHLALPPEQQHGLKVVKEWILDNFHKEIRLSELADIAAMSLRSFNRCFKRDTGLTPSAFITKARVDSARRMLEQGDLPAKTIAVEAGFGKYEAMRKAFRTTFGVTPLIYRERFKSGKLATHIRYDETNELARQAA